MSVLRAFIALASTGCAPLVRAADGRETFAEYCAACHGLDGKARTPAGKKLGAKDLSESRLSEPEIEARIVSGVRDKNGTEKMPSFKDRVAPAAMPALVAHVRSFRRPELKP